MQRILTFAPAGLMASAAPTAAENITLVTGNDWAPFTDKNLPGGGMAISIRREAFQSQGHEVNINFAL
jgi:polar amino acid transport system substrate-binding protein